MGENKYSNVIEVQIQAFDAQLKFGFQTSEGMQDETRIILSPQHLKVLSMMLEDAVKQYEEKFGVINTPNNMKVDRKTEERQ